jgi:hypothetical protein
MSFNCNHKTCEGESCRRPKKKLVRKPVRKVSRKREKINRTYSTLSKQFVEDNPYCAIKSPECTGRTQGPHHKRGRIGKALTDFKHCIPACNPCNLYVEVHDKWARENGFKESRLNPVLKQ